VAKPIKFQPNGNVANSDIFVYAVHGGRIELLGNTKEAKLG
jgi:branched-chain amino acid transport system substrate-binding protein